MNHNQQMHQNGLVPGYENVAFGIANSAPASMFEGMRQNPNDLVPVPSEYEVRLWIKIEALEARIKELEAKS